MKIKKIILFAKNYIYSATLVVGILFLSPFFSKYRRYMYKILGIMQKKPEVLIPKISTSLIIDPKRRVTLDEIDEQDGNVSTNELLIICEIVKKHKPDYIFEIGTFDGRTTLNMALNAKEKARIFSLDLPRNMKPKHEFVQGEELFVNKKEPGQRFKKRKESKKIMQLHGDSTSFNFSPYKNMIDLIFIDGSHAYPTVLKDSLNAEKMLVKKGIAIWHDYGGWDGVTRALNKIYQETKFGKNMRHIEGTSLVIRIP